jgi:DNA polymerase-3 subunit alpha
MQIIETYPHDRLAIEIMGRTYPGVCLVEDDDGIRWLLVAWGAVHGPTWARAAGSGAAGILHTAGDLPIRAITAERFADQRTEQQPYYVVPDGAWSQFDHMPSYAEVYSSRPGSLLVARGPVNSGFVHLHTHSDYSPLDGLSTLPEIVTQAALHGQESLALTDHGRCAGHPLLQKECQAAGIRPGFGIEAYFVNDRLIRPDGMTVPEGAVDTKGKPLTAAKKLQHDYWHLILWAMNEEGLHNLWAMSTESFRDGLYYKPRMDWDTLRRHSSGVMAASGCLRGPLSVPILNDDEDGARRNLTKLLDIFGDRFYLEIQPNALAEQEKVNRALVRLAKDYSVPLLATVDSHYPVKKDHDAHEAWIAIQTNKDVSDEGDLFAINLDLYMQSEEEVRKGLAYLGDSVVDEAVANTVVVASHFNAIIGGKPTAPVYSKKGGPQRDEERLLELCIENWNKVSGKRDDQDTYVARFEREFSLLRQKGFCGYFLMVSDYCRFAKDNGILVGPGRGSGAGSLVAYLSDITEVDPIEANLPFERFMTEGRVSLPDFDVDFPASKKEVMLQYLRDKYGEQYVISIGTHLRLKSKGIVKDLGRALKSKLLEDVPMEDQNDRYATILKDLNVVSKIVEDAERGTAGLGMSWEDLWIQHGDELDPYRAKYPYLFSMADRLVGRMKAYGKHAAGVVISTDRALTDWLPLSGGEGEQMVSQFDMGALEDMGLVKFDILTIRTLDTVQQAVDLIRERNGSDVEIYKWRDEYEDPLVWERIAAGETLGIFQIETQAGTRLCHRMQPHSMQELSDMNTIVRPGPMRSGLTETYLKRRAGLESISFQDPRLEAITGDAQGCIIYQDHVLELLMKLAGYTSDEADEVRKILGKKKVEKIGPAGQEFVARAVEWGGMDREVASHLWDQLAEFAKYGFNKAHAYSYSMISYWTAWLKFHYPVEFFTACLSTIDQNRIPEFIKEARRTGLTVLPPDVNASGKGFKAEPLAVRYGLDAISGIGEVAVEDLEAGQFYTSWTQFNEYATRPGSKINAGIVMLLAKVGALDSLEPNRAGLVARLEAKKSGEDTRCVFKDDRALHSPVVIRHPDESAEDHQVRYDAERKKLPPDTCTFDWSTEEPPVNPRTLKLLPLKALPKRCTKACRQYKAPDLMDIAEVAPYTDEEVRAIEHELLGVFLSSTPFDRLDVVDRSSLYHDAEDLVTGPPKLYTMAAILMGIRKTKTRATGDEMAFVSLDTELNTVEAVVFPKQWAAIQTGMKAGQLCLVVVEKQADDKGLVLREYVTV